MKQVMARGRQLGKSTLMNEIMREQAKQMQEAIDKEIIRSLWTIERYNHIKTWRARNGTKMHRIECGDEIYDWLVTEHPQQGNNNPDWWRFDRKINITDKLYTLLTLRWAE